MQLVFLKMGNLALKTYGQRLIWVVFLTNCTSQKKSSSNNYVISKSINILQSLQIKFLNLITFQNLNMASMITVLGCKNIKKTSRLLGHLSS